MRKVVVHCGANKTGTTATQATCHAGALILEKAGVFYPDFRTEQYPARSHWPFAMAFWEHPENYYAMKDAGATPQQAKAYAKQVRDTFDAQIAATDCDTVFVSSEAIGQMEPNAMKQLVAFLRERFDEVQAVYYAREPVAATMSFLQERLKGGHAMTINQFLKIKEMNFNVVARNLSAAFGPGVDFRIFDRKTLRDGDILADILCDVIGLKEVPDLRREGANESVSAQTAAVLFYVNRVVERRKGGKINPVFQEVMQYSYRPQSGPKLTFPKHGWEEAIRDAHRDSWCDLLDQAGMHEEKRRYRKLKKSDSKALKNKPNQGQFNAWMARNLEGLNVDELPPAIADLLLRGIVKE